MQRNRFHNSTKYIRKERIKIEHEKRRNRLGLKGLARIQKKGGRKKGEG